MGHGVTGLRIIKASFYHPTKGQFAKDFLIGGVVRQSLNDGNDMLLGSRVLRRQ